MSLSAPLSPKDVLSQLAKALPESCRNDVIIIGSLAAGYYFFADDGSKGIRTKDIDCMFSPYAKAVPVATRVTEELLSANWAQRAGEQWSAPGKPDDPTDALPMVRLKPPGGSEWFLELLGAPDAWQPGVPMKQFHRVSTTAGDFAICSFGYLSLAEHEPLLTQFDVRIARPAMMALANLLHHERIGPELMSGTAWKRSNKDLGRVLALSYLTSERDRRDGTEELGKWAGQMWAALGAKFAAQAKPLALRAGSGVRALLESPEDLDQALAIANLGLLTSMDVSREAFAATGRRFVAEVIEPLEALGRSSSM